MQVLAARSQPRRRSSPLNGDDGCDQSDVGVVAVAIYGTRKYQTAGE